MTDRLLTGSQRTEDSGLDRTLRPQSLEAFVGQSKLKERLRIFIDAAKGREEPLEHVLFTGPPGLGKTTLATIIAAEMGVTIRTTSGPAIERPGDLAATLTRLARGDVLFIDEIHRLSRSVEEILYPAMEDFLLDIVVGKGPTAQTLRLPLKPFTLVAATTRPAMMTAPLRDRFGESYSLDYYDPAALKTIVLRSAQILGVQIESEGAEEIARRSRGTPRIANRLLKRVRDYAQVRADGLVTLGVAVEALEQLQVDHLGLDEVDRRMLLTIVRSFDGGPVGLDTIAAATSEEADTIMDMYEPYLIRLGFLARTPRGRVATRLAYEHLGLTPPAGSAQPTLFDAFSASGGADS